MNVKWLNDCDPSNGTIVLVETTDGVVTIGYQNFGEWNDALKMVHLSHNVVKRWRYLTKDILFALRKYVDSEEEENAN